EFSPKGLMEQLGMPAVQTADPQVLTKASLKTRIKGSTTQVKLAPLTLHLDDTTLEGYVALPRFKGPTLRFDLAVNAIDADRYLPPGKTAGSAPPSATPGAAATSASGEVPLEPLRTLDMDGRLRIGKLKISKLSIQDVVVKLTGKQGLIKLDPIAAQLYEGNYDGHIHFDARGKQPKVSVNEKLVGVQAGPLLKDMLGEERLTGTAKLNAKLSTTGLDADTARAKLNGNVNFSFMEGAVKGINIGQMIREAKAKLKGEPATPSEEEAKTDFSELSGSIKLVNGLASNDDLQAKSPLLRIKGKGKVDLVKEQIDYLLTTVIVGTSKGQGGSELDDLKGVPIPVKVTGTFQDPSYSPALGEVLKGKATQEVKQKAKKKLEEKLGDKAKGLFKGLFD
ncbi:MAG: AsmA family protein, partial [Gammaproteobacteria bacterium]|nr:AsmA family protein [Gammaproteobacteria bacterium]